jgi:hypothetical protein
MYHSIRSVFMNFICIGSFLGILSLSAEAQWMHTNGPFGGYVKTLASKDSIICAGTYDGIFISTNSGSAWSRKSGGIVGTNIQAVAINPNGPGVMSIYAGTTSGGIFRSTNNGINWTVANNGLTNTDIYALLVSNTNVFVGTASGCVFRTTNNGANWTTASINAVINPVITLAKNVSYLFAGTRGGGAYRSTNNGSDWGDINSGLTNQKLNTFLVNGSNLFAGTSGDGVFRRPLSEIVTSVDKTVAGLPIDFVLEQNYPNPFNPSTTISFNLPIQSYVVIKIYDVIGRKVETLVNGEYSAGSYSKIWNASSFPNGVYFYSLQASRHTGRQADKLYGNKKTYTD